MGIEKKRSTLSVLFYIKRQKLLKNGEAPVCMRITVDKRKAEIMIKRSVPVELWNQSKECSKGKDRSSQELNHYISSVRAKVLQIHRELEVDAKMITADAIRDRYYGRDKVQHTLLEIYTDHNEKCRALIGKEYTESTVIKFETSINRLREFIRFGYHKDDLFLNELDGQFVRDFEYWLKTSIGCQNNSALKHLKNLKKVIRIAFANGWIEKDPFYGIHFKMDEVNVEFLSQEELDRLMKKDFEIKRLEQVRDVFAFCCYTGLAFADVHQLSKEHLVKDNDGNLWIRKARQKTKQMCNIPVISPARKLIDKHSHQPDCIAKNVLLPVLSNQKMNAYLKEIADICGIQKRLTTHVARHTAATVVFLANEVSMENVAKILWKIQCKLPPKTKRFCPLKTFNNAPLKSLDRWGYYYFSLFPSVCSHFTDTFSCQLNPVRRMYNTIHNGICYCRVSDCIIPIVRWQLRGDDDGLAPMSVLYYIEQDGSFLGIKVHKEEVIQYEQRAPFDSLEFRFQCAFYFCHLKRTHKFRSIRIICPYALLAGFIPHCCGKEALPGTG